MTSKITIRPMVPTDLNFILSTWLREYRQSDTCRRMNNDDYFSTYEPMVKDNCNALNVIIACLIDDPDVIIGYLCREHNHYSISQNIAETFLHFIYVKDSWRKLGLMKMLISSANLQGPTYFTHWTSPVNSLSNKYPQFRYNPFKFTERK